MTGRSCSRTFFEKPAPRILSDGERRDWLRLIRSENIGPVIFFELLERFGSAGDALRAIPELARRGGLRRALKVISPAAIDDDIRAHERVGARRVAFVEPDYPPLLREISHPPPVLSVRGHGHVLQKPAVSVVGARNASAAGCLLARSMAAELGAHGLIVVSGSARGIDTAAHEGALSHGTVAVVGGGVDVAYPRDNAELMERIAAAGAVIGEHPIGTVPQNRHFPRRNRIIAGMARGVLVVEAKLRSGSLITARNAAEEGRGVFAVPGSPLDPRAKGCNNLLHDGAVLTRSAADVLAVLDTATPLTESRGEVFSPPHSARPSEKEISAARAKVKDLLSTTAVSVDEIIRQCQLTSATVLAVLLELELGGRVERHPGNKISLNPNANGD